MYADFPGGGSGSLSEQFPEIEIKTRSSFAHDYGDMVTVEEVKCGGEVVSLKEIPEKLVKLRGGWTTDSEVENADAIAKATFLALRVRLSQASGDDVLVGETCPDDMKRLIGSFGGPDYHAPKAEIHDVDGQQLIVVTFYVRGHISQRGRHWSYYAFAVDLKTGANYELPVADRNEALMLGVPAATDATQSLPKTQYFSEAGF